MPKAVGKYSAPTIPDSDLTLIAYCWVAYKRGGQHLGSGLNHTADLLISSPVTSYHYEHETESSSKDVAETAHPLSPRGRRLSAHFPPAVPMLHNQPRAPLPPSLRQRAIS